MINEWRGKLTLIQQEARKHRQDHLEALAQNYANQHNLTQQRRLHLHHQLMSNLGSLMM